MSKTIGIIGDEDIINGFMIAGIRNNEKNPNLIEVTITTPEDDLKAHFASLVTRDDLALILLCDFVYEKILEDVEKYNQDIPVILKIPSRIK